MIAIKSARLAVKPYIEAIVTASNSERNSFGFLPKSAYFDFADRGQILVAVDDETDALTGYVIFAGALPSAKVRQTYVHPDWRGRGVGKLLIDALIGRCEELSYLSIKATVAADLLAANSFYEKNGFIAVTSKPGGRTTNRTLNVRVRELETPSLLNFASYRRASQPQIYLDVPTSGPAPQYLFDLNVLFDSVRKRQNDGAGEVFAAAFENSVRLAISEEFVVELKRTAEQFPDDPILQLARRLPVVKRPSSNSSSLRADLAELIFADRNRLGNLTPQDKSDIDHLETAIVENTAGFITSEKAILRQRDEIRLRYGIDVVSPKVFASADPELLPKTLSQIEISLEAELLTSRKMTSEDELSARALLDGHHAPATLIKAALSQGTSRIPRSRVVVRNGNQLVAFATWQQSSSAGAVRLYLFADYSHQCVELAIDHLLDFACRAVTHDNPAIVNLKFGRKDVFAKERAAKAGFNRNSTQDGPDQDFQKICLGHAVTSDNWTHVCNTLDKRFGLRLPTAPPDFRAEDQKIALSTKTGSLAQVKMLALEDFLSPTLLALQGRPAVIVPIWPSFAEALFRGSTQPDFLAGQRAQIVTEKCYLLSRGSINRIPEHGLIAFYESEGSGKAKGRSAAIAVGRIRRRYLASEEAACRLAQLRGVLPQSEIRQMAKGKDVCVVEFDNLLTFRKPIKLAKLQEIGCADGAKLVTAKKIDSEAVKRMFELGEPYAATYA